jgi:hypothetical protein
MVRLYTFHLAFKNTAGDDIRASSDVSAQCYETYAVGDTLPLRYLLKHPSQVVPATMHWFQPRSLDVLALGLALLFAGLTAKRKTQS